MNLRYFGSKRILAVKKINQISGNGCFELNYTILRSVVTTFTWSVLTEVGVHAYILKKIKIRTGCVMTQAVSRWPVTPELGFDSQPVHMVYVVHNLPLGKAFSEYLVFSPVNIIH